jgi:phosphohistidine phosphatase SixA
MIPGAKNRNGEERQMHDLTVDRSVLRRGLFVIFLLIALPTAYSQSLSGKDLVAALRTGGYVILMRHASSPRDAPDAAHADGENVAHERQLDEGGRTSARAMGEALRRLHIPIDDVLSSPTYRALQTIKLAQLRSPTTATELGDSGQSMGADKSGTRAAWLKAKSAVVPAPHENTLIVTHFPNIIEAYPEAQGLGDGEALILHPNGQGGAAIVARVKMNDWISLDSIR